MSHQDYSKFVLALIALGRAWQPNAVKDELSKFRKTLEEAESNAKRKYGRFPWRPSKHPQQASIFSRVDEIKRELDELMAKTSFPSTDPDYYDNVKEILDLALPDLEHMIRVAAENAADRRTARNREQLSGRRAQNPLTQMQVTAGPSRKSHARRQASEATVEPKPLIAQPATTAQPSTNAQQSWMDRLLNPVVKAYNANNNAHGDEPALRHFCHQIRKELPTANETWPIQGDPFSERIEAIIQQLCEDLEYAQFLHTVDSSTVMHEEEQALDKLLPLFEELKAAQEPSRKRKRSPRGEATEVTAQFDCYTTLRHSLLCEAHQANAADTSTSPSPPHSVRSIGHAARLVMSPRQQRIYATASL